MSVTVEQLGRVAVLMGGDSAEREISLKSGQAVLDALLRTGVNAERVDLRFNEQLFESLSGYDRYFIALHGRGGEDGVIQAVLDVLGKPYTGSGVTASSIAMNKVHTKHLWKGADIATPAFRVVGTLAQMHETVESLGLPLMVKPACEGSSVGMTRLEDVNDIQPAFEQAIQYDETILLEEWITGSEYTVAILGRDTLPVIRLETTRAFYDFAAKYQSGDTQYHCPSGLSETKERELQRLALDAYECIGCKGWGRVDAMMNEAGEMSLLEVNTVPGMTEHSLVPMAAKAAGIDFDELVWRILSQTV